MERARALVSPILQQDSRPTGFQTTHHRPIQSRKPLNLSVEAEAPWATWDALRSIPQVPHRRQGGVPRPLPARKESRRAGRKQLHVVNPIHKKCALLMLP